MNRSMSNSCGGSPQEIDNISDNNYMASMPGAIQELIEREEVTDGATNGIINYGSRLRIFSQLDAKNDVDARKRKAAQIRQALIDKQAEQEIDNIPGNDFEECKDGVSNINEAMGKRIFSCRSSIHSKQQGIKPQERGRS